MHDNRVDLIIVNWNGRKFLPKCLKGVSQQTYRCFSTTLVDNGSTDGSVSFVAKNYPEVNIIRLENNSGFCFANNIALNAVRAKYVALLNNDAVPHPLWLQHLVKSIESKPEAGMVASKMLYYDNPNIIDRAGDGYTRAGAGLLRGRGENREKFNKHEWVFGACSGAALYRTKMLKDIGFFDERFFLLYEDVDLSFRAQIRGYKCIYVPEAVVYHLTSKTIGYDSSHSVYYGQRNLEWVYIQNMPLCLIWKTLGHHLLYDLGAFFYFLTRGRKKVFIKAKWDAIKGLKSALRKRKQIQSNKKVHVDYIWNLMDKETYYSRWIRRLK